MPAVNTLNSSMAAGLLSESSAENPNLPFRAEGLTQARNVRLLKHGGLVTRPPFVRAVEEAVPWVTHSAIDQVVLDAPDTQMNITGPDAEKLSRPMDRRPLPPSGANGVVPFQVEIENANSEFFTVYFKRPVRALTLHDCRLLAGNAITDGGLTFSVNGSAKDADPYSFAAFAPGLVSSDVTIFLENPTRSIAISSNLRASDPHTKPRLAFSGLSSLVDGGPGVPVSIPKQHALITWTLGGIDMLLVLGVQCIDLYQVKDDGSLTELGNTVDLHYFTPRQLDELGDPEAYRNGLLLAHNDFIRPLYLRLTSNSEFELGGWEYSNVPDLPSDIARSALGEVTVDDEDKLKIVRHAGSFPAPESLEAVGSASGDNEIDLSWALPVEADTFDVIWATKDSHDLDPWELGRLSDVPSDQLTDRTSLVGDESATGFTNPRAVVRDLTAAVPYVFTVRANYSDGRSDFIAPVAATPYPLPPKVTGVTVTLPTGANVSDRPVKWDAVTYAASYELEHRPEPQGLLPQWVRVEADEAMHTVVVSAPELRHQFRVRVVFPNGNVGEWSDVFTSEGIPAFDTPPSNFRVTRSTDHPLSVDMSWDLPPGTVSLHLEYRKGTTGSVRATRRFPSTTLFPLPSAGSWQFRVSAQDSRGRRTAPTPWSAAVELRRLATPTNLRLQAGGSVLPGAATFPVSLVWDPVPGADMYHVVISSIFAVPPFNQRTVDVSSPRYDFPALRNLEVTLTINRIYAYDSRDRGFDSAPVRSVDLDFRTS